MSELRIPAFLRRQTNAPEVAEVFCRNCRHLERYNDGSIDDESLCLHPSAQYSELSVVTGEHVMSPQIMALSFRLLGACGSAAKLFEPREVTTP